MSRLDKTFVLNGRYRLTAVADVYNLFNTNAETNFVLRTGGGFNSIIEWIPARTLKLGVRLEF